MLGTVFTAVPHTLITHGLRRLSATTVSFTLALQVPYATLLAALVLSETPAHWRWPAAPWWWPPPVRHRPAAAPAGGGGHQRLTARATWISTTSNSASPSGPGSWASSRWAWRTWT
ncbi:hypothetical protein HML84_16885 [Alcanivorax sp. IO_7]|nr:hypothetical protein HML84_16885 [Alcanivorax sp. IO_7]